MIPDEIFLRKAVASASGLIYWAGVLIQARRVRKQIGRSPNMTPKGGKERVLWIGWMLVIAGWVGQPWAAAIDSSNALLKIHAAAMNPASLSVGVLLVLGGYGGTLWCYRTMGNAWRIGVNEAEKNQLVTSGPFARVRHPIYALQVVMLAGVLALVPTIFSLGILGFHLICVWWKAADEEAYLTATHGDSYRAHISRTGRLFPKLRKPG